MAPEVLVNQEQKGVIGSTPWLKGRNPFQRARLVGQGHKGVERFRRANNQSPFQKRLRRRGQVSVGGHMGIDF
jgi:hypothetical protein